jgi:hypothetical protein
MPNTRVSGVRVGPHPASLAFEASREDAAPLTVVRVAGKRRQPDRLIVTFSDGKVTVLHDVPADFTLGRELPD